MKLTEIQVNILTQMLTEHCNHINDQLRDAKSRYSEGYGASEDEYARVLSKATVLKELHLIALELVKEQKNKKVANDIKRVSRSQIKWIDKLLGEAGVKEVATKITIFDE